MVAVVLVVVGVFVQQISLERTRPADSRAGEAAKGLQTVPARLWQDPMDVAKKDMRALLAQGEDGRRLLNEKPSRLFLGLQAAMSHVCARVDAKGEALCAQPDLAVVGVAVPGGGYAENIEGRRRTRYAVLSALAQASLRPHDSEHLDYLVLGDFTSRNPAVVPYELFTHRDGDAPVLNDKPHASRMVLVLWIDSQDVDARTRFNDALSAAGLLAHARHRKLVLASGTDGLQDVLRKWREDQWPDVDILSATSTVDDSFLDQSIRVNVYGMKRRVYRTIGTDRRLAIAIANELALRDVFPGCESGPQPWGKKQAHVLLVSEWDTAYSRALPETFSTVLRATRACSGGASGAPWIHRLSYMRGLDGEVLDSGRDGDGGKGGGKRDSKKEGQGAEDILAGLGRLMHREKAEGDSQFDYVRRITQHAADINARLAQGKGEIMAVGVLGSDYYDKLLILQALRKAYPKAVFFTTDMDARLVQEDQYPWTRNVLVASHYGLELNAALQGEIPPFRDSYQAATFLATTLAIQPPCRGRLDAKRLDAFFQEPRVFEIGRRGAVELTRSAGAGAAQGPLCLAGAEGEFFGQLRSLHPEPTPQWKWPFGWLVLGIVLATTALAALLSSRFYAAVIGIVYRHWPGAAGVALVGGGFLVLLFTAVAESPIEEPLLLAHGISIWGTEILRFAAIVLTLVFLCKAFSDIRKSDEKLTRDFVPGADSSTVKLRMREFLLPWNYAAFSNEWKGKGNTARTKFLLVIDLWSNYVRLAGRWSVALRAFIATVAFMSIGMILFAGDLPNRPIRGPISHTVDFVLLVVAVLLYVFLAFYVADAVRMCKSFVRHLATNKTEWPEETTRRFIAGIANGVELPEYLVKYNYMRDYIDMRLIAERTEAIGQLIYYPFLILLLVVCARSPIFDNWEWNAPLVVVIGFTAALIALSAYGLRVAAEEVRDLALRRQSSELLRAKARKDDVAVDLLETAIDLVKNVTEGAYRPFTQQPIVRGLLIPFAGYGGLAILEFLLIGKT